MFASATTDAAWLASAIASILFSFGFILMIRRKDVKSLSLQVGSIRGSIDTEILPQVREIDRKIESVEKSVNNVGPAQPTLVQRVVALETKFDHIIRNQDWERLALAQIADFVGANITDRREGGYIYHVEQDQD